MNIELQIPKETFAKIMHWVNKSDKEVSGFGKVKFWKETGVFEVQDVYLLKQENGSAHTDIDPASLSKLLYTSREVEGDLRFWWHSHVNMAVFWSAQDRETINELGQNGWIVASVFNKKEEIRTAVCHMAQKKSPLFGTEDAPTLEFIDDVATYIMDPDVTDEMKAAWDKEFAENVTEKATSVFLDDDEWERRPDGTWDYKPKKKEPSLLNDTKSEHVVKKSLRDEYLTHGYFGFGLKQEAKVLGMAPKTYLETLLTADVVRIREIEHDLEKATIEGVLV